MLQHPNYEASVGEYDAENGGVCQQPRESCYGKDWGLFLWKEENRRFTLRIVAKVKMLLNIFESWKSLKYSNFSLFTNIQIQILSL